MNKSTEYPNQSAASESNEENVVQLGDFRDMSESERRSYLDELNGFDPGLESSEEEKVLDIQSLEIGAIFRLTMKSGESQQYKVVDGGKGNMMLEPLSGERLMGQKKSYLSLPLKGEVEVGSAFTATQQGLENERGMFPIVESFRVLKKGDPQENMDFVQERDREKNLTQMKESLSQSVEGLPSGLEEVDLAQFLGDADESEFTAGSVDHKDLISLRDFEILPPESNQGEAVYGEPFNLKDIKSLDEQDSHLLTKIRSAFVDKIKGMLSKDVASENFLVLVDEKNEKSE